VSDGLEVEDRLAAAFMSAGQVYPYFSSGLAILVRRVTEIPSATMAVTRDGILLADPRFVALYQVRQLAEALVHELSHLLRDHAGRSDLVATVDRYRWNVAADCEINCGLARNHLPGGACLPGKFFLPDGLLAEEYYDRLPRDLGFDLWEVCSGACGSGSGGETVNGEPLPGGVEGRSQADILRARSEVAAAVVEHASSRGDVPGNLLRWAKGELRPPRVRWQDRLRRLVRAGVSVAAGKVDYDWSRPGRRQIAASAVVSSLGGDDVVLPTLRGRAPRIAVGVDTSGSMGEGEIVAAMSEIEGVLRAVGTPTVFLACDSKLAGPPRMMRGAREAAKLLRGGGDTNFGPVLDAVGRLRPRPRLFVFVTDGLGPAPKAPPEGVSVLWVLMGPNAKKPTSWGESVFVKDVVDEKQ
jgi:predicted metal-dependent peptidase